MAKECSKKFMNEKIPNFVLCELNILRNRLESGDSIFQCLSTMGAPLPQKPWLREHWNRVAKLMLDGRILPAKAVTDLTQQLDTLKKLQDLVAQKTLSPKIQGILSFGLILLISLSSFWLFPVELRPTGLILAISLALSFVGGSFMAIALQRLTRKLCFLDWIAFQRSLCLSLQCGTSLRSALVENFPTEAVLSQWPEEISASLANLTEKPLLRAKLPVKITSPLWQLGNRSWQTVVRQYERGLPLNEMVRRLSELQEYEFRVWIQVESEKLGYLLLIPLFLFNLPAVLILLFAPLLSVFRLY